MKYCGNCRLQLQDNVRHCPRCGASQIQRGPVQHAPPRANPPQAQRPSAYPQRAQPAGYPPQYPQRSPPRAQRPSQPSQQPQPPRSPSGSSFCGKCGVTLRYIIEAGSYYCDRCMEYKGAPSAPPRGAGPSVRVPAREQPYQQVRTAEPSRPTSPDTADDTPVFNLDSILSEDDETKLNKKISSALKRIKQIIHEKETDGYDTEELVELYRQCGNVYASDDLYTAVHYLENIADLLDRMKAQSTPMEQEQAADRDGEPAAGDEEVEDFFDDGSHKSAYDDGVVVFEDAPAEDQDHFELEDTPKIGEKERAIQALESAKNAITDADEDGYDTQAAKQLFRDARPLYEAGDFKAVLERVREVEREVLRVKGHAEHEIEELMGEPPVSGKAAKAEEKKELSAAERQELKEMINKVWVSLREAEAYGIDTSVYKERLEQARSRRTFADARSMVEDVGGNLRNKLTSFHDIQHDRASNMYHYVRSEILGASKLGLDVTEYQSMLDRASSSISRSNYSDAINTMESCLEKLKAAAGSGKVQGTAGASSGEHVKKPEPVWDPDDDDNEKEMPDDAAGSAELTDEERLKILEDRFILGEVSEESYRELKSKLVARMSAKHIK